jgi:hypothetical protein
MMAGMITLILTGLLRGLSTRSALVLENLALRHQLAVLQRTARRPCLRPSDRVFWVLLCRLWGGWTEAVFIVQPGTVLRWHRTRFRRFWTWKSRRHGPGRPAVAPAVRALIRHMSRANPLWGAPRIHGELQKLGIGSRRPRSRSTWPVVGHRHRKLGAPFSTTTSGAWSP